jgi:hypothetical protein
VCPIRICISGCRETNNAHAAMPQQALYFVVVALLLFGACWPPTAVPAPYWARRVQEKIKTAAKAAAEVLNGLAIVVLLSTGIPDLDWLVQRTLRLPSTQRLFFRTGPGFS